MRARCVDLNINFDKSDGKAEAQEGRTQAGALLRRGARQSSDDVRWAGVLMLELFVQVIFVVGFVMLTKKIQSQILFFLQNFDAGLAFATVVHRAYTYIYIYIYILLQSVMPLAMTRSLYLL